MEIITNEKDLIICFKDIIEHTQRKITKEQIKEALETALKEVA